MGVKSFLRRDRSAESMAWALWEALHDAYESLKGSVFGLALVDVDVASLPVLTVLSRLMDALESDLNERGEYDAK